MGRKHQSYEVGDLTDKQIKELRKSGKAPMITPKEQKKADKDFKYKTQGKKVDLGGTAAGISDFFRGRNGTR